VSASLEAAEAPPGSEPPRQLWLYYSTNFQSKGSVEKAQQIWSRAAKAGYTHVMLADSKLSHLATEPDFYFRNVEEAKKIAADLHLTLVPALFDVGYSNSLLTNDPNLAEGLPVKDALFVVHDGQARLIADPDISLPAKPSFGDDNLTVTGTSATFNGAAGGNCRLSFKLSLPEYRCYHVSVKVKTADFKGEVRIQALAGERGLQWQNLGVKHTQDWTEHDVVFNSLDHKEVTLYFGVWGVPPRAAAGSLQWKDWKIEEAGLVNVLRRSGTPLVVKSDEGKVLVVGTDYEKVVDPHMGNVPWPGSYQSWHEAPPIKLMGPSDGLDGSDGSDGFGKVTAGKLRAGAAVKDGVKLRVSWYHPALIYDEQVCACIEEPKTMELLADQAKRVKALFDAPAYMMSHDEFRVLGWDESCTLRRQTPGQMLADNVRRCRELLGPQKAYVWNDMFDPHHNAVAGPYYLVNGPWTGSWEGLDKDVTIVNWNYGHRDESLKFFADRGHKQIIAGYYDGGQDTAKWLASADKVKGVEGIMYTTWRNDFDHMEEFAKSCRR
jgi:hypothetical protein